LVMLESRHTHKWKEKLEEVGNLESSGTSMYWREKRKKTSTMYPGGYFSAGCLLYIVDTPVPSAMYVQLLHYREIVGWMGLSSSSVTDKFA